jgi:HPr kinase/phosphorylase
MPRLTVEELYQTHAERLVLEWVAGLGGQGRCIESEGLGGSGAKASGVSGRAGAEGMSPDVSLVGHLNLIHPNQVQVLGHVEIQYLQNLREISRQDAVRQLLGQQPVCIIVAEDQAVPEQLAFGCDETDTPLLSSHLSSDKLVDALHYYLSNFLAEVVTLHGVYMEVMAIGVLLTGASGVGKSELALELITRGHRLVADDAPGFSRIAPDVINGTCPKALIDFLEVRGLGIINVRALFGDSAIKGNKYLRLIVRLERMDSPGLIDMDRLEGSYRTRRILDVDIPEITIPVASGRNLSVLVECAARNHILRINGYKSSEDFMKRQGELIEKSRN